MAQLKVALVGGPMYDHLYDQVADVEVVVHADHPTLNRRVAELLAAGERLDVISTHSKYAPSQRQWLRPLDLDTSPLAPAAVDLCTFRGEVLSVPRCIDVRVLWSRKAAPTTPSSASVGQAWDELAASDVVFGFPGRESGLFGTFFELVVSRGGRLFDEDARPTIDTPEARWAVETLVALAARAPSDLPDWHYDEVDAALHAGRIDAAGVWPGGTADVRDAGDDLRPHPYPGGISYAGCHSWAIPTTCGDVDGALAYIEAMTGFESSMVDAENGTVPANVAAFAAVEPEDEIDARRLAITRDTIATGMITYPPLERFPAVEDAGWQAINDALRGRADPADVPARIQAAAAAVLA
ncbi:MAG: multiple sugar transport system substrate-binding protein [Actinomycetota bacterium]|nr:multiple sugar transport system substrate-binding protein [Actinomycetota bacterium]